MENFMPDKFFFMKNAFFFNYSSNLQAKSHILALKLITFNKKR